MSSDGTVLIVDRAANVARLVNGGLFGEKGAVATCAGSSLSHSLVAAGGRAVVAEICPDGAWTSFFVDLEAGRVLHEVASASQVQAISPDGTQMVGHVAGDPLPPGTPGSDFGGYWVGPLTVHDVGSGRPLLELEGHCTWGFNGPADHCTRYPDSPFLMWAWKLAWAPDGRYLAAVNNGSAGESAAYVVVWDLSSGAIVADHRCSGRATGVVFAPDANEMVVSCDDGELVGIDTGTWTAPRTHLLDPSVTGRDAVGFIGYGAGGGTLMAVGGDAGEGVGELLWIDTDTFSAEGDPLQAFTGSPKSYAISPDRTTVAVGSSDGFVKVFDVESRLLVDEFTIEGQVQGLGFVDDETLVVAPENGNLVMYTLDVAELVDMVQESLRRGFTPLECER